MKATISLDGILAFLRSLSLSASNKEWLGQKLIEDAHREMAAAGNESYEDFINRMCGAWSDDPRTAEENASFVLRENTMIEYVLCLWFNQSCVFIVFVFLKRF